MQRLEFDTIMEEFNIIERKKDLYYGNIIYLYKGKKIVYDERISKEDLIKYLIQLVGCDKECNEILLKIINRILYKYKVISMRDWLLDDVYNYKYIMSLDNEIDPFKREFRNRLQEFDDTFLKDIFINKDILDRFDISLGCINKRDNSFNMRITDKFSNNYIEYIRSNAYIGFEVVFDLFSVRHYYQVSDDNFGEYIHICSPEKCIKYNISDNNECFFLENEFGNIFENKKEILLNDYEFIYNSLLDGIGYANKFTDNLVLRNNLKREYKK